MPTTAAQLIIDQLTLRMPGLSHWQAQQLAGHLRRALQHQARQLEHPQAFAQPFNGAYLPNLQLRIQYSDGQPLSQLADQIAGQLIKELRVQTNTAANLAIGEPT